MAEFNFKIEKKIAGRLGRAGTIMTPHGDISTPAFITVGTKATVKALSPEQVMASGSPAALANTYHLLLEPGAEAVARAGGLHRYMNWPGPLITDSGGFQVFSLGAAYDEGGINKFLKPGLPSRTAPKRPSEEGPREPKPAKIDEDGVTFRSPLDGAEHRLTPESSIQIQHQLGADIIFAFDECTAPTADYVYQKEAMNRTHRWAERSLAEHERLTQAKTRENASKKVLGPLQASLEARLFDKHFPESYSALFGIVQGGRFQDLREASAKFIASLPFAGFGIGGSFDKTDMGTAVGWVNAILPTDKPRHLLGIGEPEDMFEAVAQGADTFDCVTPTRLARHATLLTATGRLNILNAAHRDDPTSIEADCDCYACQNYSRAYLAHLFRAGEIFGATLATIHNLRFMNRLSEQMRAAILAERFLEFKAEWLAKYQR
ncbi:MAG: tRNA guanosine(34) transglycosylase Tgt [Candidatus Vogelbacteria bacterium CG10_big_fil_rev_8_21_14_0_10_49_38]|uniref:Queuine tRNA-ribosyltransferase n=1 Tax=Candidatus Vogelbacteria bacterium CG10_big_fil_rev_8_21_14_0_10_49_38 TaxID=1975043 RepID=A0A2H0RI31_9BACT|nr:MAG: hypothetical protein BK006_01050 [bacterium CG10_49_38]PIR46189.1 MAG: tRNA guanosine(34) transglycosylase Tgt [Candidatus Vogelbacteria bacterium CG10_big_fil_rev_8_21_14_0_10_49_38]